jgi:hypothetical protein
MICEDVTKKVLMEALKYEEFRVNGAI